MTELALVLVELRRWAVSLLFVRPGSSGAKETSSPLNTLPKKDTTFYYSKANGTLYHSVSLCVGACGTAMDGQRYHRGTSVWVIAM